MEEVLSLKQKIEEMQSEIVEARTENSRLNKEVEFAKEQNTL